MNGGIESHPTHFSHRVMHPGAICEAGLVPARIRSRASVREGIREGCPYGGCQPGYASRRDHVYIQQIRGNCSPLNMRMTRWPPMALPAMTTACVVSLTRPMTSASCPCGWA